MITSLAIEQYRGFEKYVVQGLSRVNLLVGANNCGKTSLLEAVYLLAQRGNPDALSEIAARRGEVMRVDPESHRSIVPDVSHFFHGHRTDLGKKFDLRAPNGAESLTVSVEELPDKRRVEYLERGVPATPSYMLRSKCETGVGTTYESLLTADGGLIAERTIRLRRTEANGAMAGITKLLTLSSLGPASLREMWDRVLTDRREAEVFDAIRLVEPRLLDVAFRSSEGSRLGRDLALVAIEDVQQRMPIGSFGDGLGRLLEIAVSLVCASGGSLLIDEIDTGLHYSILGKMWTLLVRGAETANIQVFATTHSWDCVEGLAWLCKTHSDLGGLVSLQKIVPRLATSIAFDAHGITSAVESRVEMR